MQTFRRAWAWFVAVLRRQPSAPIRGLIALVVGIGLVFVLLPVALLYELVSRISSDRTGPALNWTIAAASFAVVVLIVAAARSPQAQVGAAVSASPTPTFAASQTPSLVPTPSPTPPSCASGQHVSGFQCADNTPLPTATPVPTPTLVPPTPDQVALLTGIARSTFSGNNNRDLPYLTDVNVIAQIDGGYGVPITYSASDNFSTCWIKRGIELDMIKVYKALFTSGNDVRWASVVATFSLVDQYGNSSEDPVYKTILEGSEAQHVNWADTGAVDWPSVWQTTFLNVEMQSC